MKSSQISRSDAKELLQPSANRITRLFVRALMPWLEIRRLTVGINEITISPEKEAQIDAETSELLGALKKTLEERKAEGREEASIEHDRALDELIDSVDRETKRLKDTIVKQQSNHNDHIDHLKANHQDELVELKNGHTRALRKSLSTPEGLIKLLLPNITLKRDSLEFLMESGDQPRICQHLKILNDRPEEVRGKRVKMTEWRELCPTKKDRIYYRKSQDARSYHVLIGDKKSQPRDIDWMRNN